MNKTWARVNDTPPPPPSVTQSYLLKLSLNIEMSDQGVVRGTRQRSISDSGHPRLNSTSIDNDLVFNNIDLYITRNNLSHQSQQIISGENPEGFIE